MVVNNPTPFYKSLVDWYYIDEYSSNYDKNYRGRVIPRVAGYDDPKKYKGTELYIPAGTRGIRDGDRFEDEDGNDVGFVEEYFKKI